MTARAQVLGGPHDGEVVEVRGVVLELPDMIAPPYWDSAIGDHLLPEGFDGEVRWRRERYRLRRDFAGFWWYVHERGAAS